MFIFFNVSEWNQQVPSILLMLLLLMIINDNVLYLVLFLYELDDDIEREIDEQDAHYECMYVFVCCVHV